MWVFERLLANTASCREVASIAWSADCLSLADVVCSDCTVRSRSSQSVLQELRVEIARVVLGILFSVEILSDVSYLKDSMRSKIDKDSVFKKSIYFKKSIPAN